MSMNKIFGVLVALFVMAGMIGVAFAEDEGGAPGDSGLGEVGAADGEPAAYNVVLELTPTTATIINTGTATFHAGDLVLMANGKAIGKFPWTVDIEGNPFPNRDPFPYAYKYTVAIDAQAPGTEVVLTSAGGLGVYATGIVA